MLNRAIIYANIILGVTIIITLVWSTPYLLSSLALYRAGQELTAALLAEGNVSTRWDVMNPNTFDLTAEEIQSLSPERLKMAQKYLCQAIKRDKSALVAYRALGEVLFAQEGRYTDTELTIWQRRFSAHLRAGIFYWRERDYEAAEVTLQEARRHSPYDLLVSLYLSDVYAQLGKLAEAEQKRADLAQYRLIQDERLYLQMAHALPRLLEAGFWSNDDAAHLVNFFLWHGDADSADVALDYLLAQDDAARWHYGRGRARQLHAQYPDAAEEFNQAIALDPQYAAAYCALGKMYAEDMPDAARAADAYAQYLALAPHDVVAMARLTESYRAVGQDAEAAGLEKSLRAYADARLAAEILQTDIISLGVNLASNGGFEEGRDGWRGWKWSDMANGKTWNAGWFEGGIDAFDYAEGDRAAHVQAFWKQEDKELPPARAGFWHEPLDLKVNTLYLVSFYYRTRGLQDGQTSVWLSPADNAPLAHDHRLPATHGQWRKVAIVGWSKPGATPTAPNQIRPLLRIWDIGDAWFDDLQVREIVVADGAVARDMAPRVVVK